MGHRGENETSCGGERSNHFCGYQNLHQQQVTTNPASKIAESETKAVMLSANLGRTLFIDLDMAKLPKLIVNIPNRYTIIKSDGGYILYDKETQGVRAAIKFIGKFYISTDGNKYVFNDEYYADFDALIYAMNEYAKTLPFNIENYNPSYREHIIIEFCLADYLDSLGFKIEWGGYNSSNFLLKNNYGEVLCKIGVDVERDTKKGSVIRYINDSSWQEANFTDLDSAIAACNSLLAGYFALTNAQSAGVLSKMTSSRASEVYNKTFDVKTLTTYITNAKEAAIKMLEEELKRLKGE